MAQTDEWRESIIQNLENELGTVRTHPSGPLVLVALPIILGILMRNDGPMSLTDQIVFLSIFGPIVIGAVLLGTQKMHLIPGGIGVKKLFRRSKEIQWDEISAVGYSRWLRFISLRSNRGLLYFNSTDGLQGADIFLVIAIYRVKGWCPEALQDELEGFFKLLEPPESEGDDE